MNEQSEKTTMPGTLARNPDAILTEKEMAQYRRVSVRTVQRGRINGGGVPYLRLSERRIGYRMADILAWIAARTVISTSSRAWTVFNVPRSKPRCSSPEVPVKISSMPTRAG